MLQIENPALRELASVVGQAVGLHRQAVNCADPWRLLGRMIEASERLSVDELLALLERLADDAFLQPAGLVLARRACQRYPDLAWVWFHLGRHLLLEDANSQEALPALERAWQLAPEERAQFAVCLSAAYLAVKRWRDAESTCQLLLAAAPSNADAWSNLSIALRSQQRCREAVEVARQALHCDPHHQHAPKNLVLALTDECRYSEALDTARELITTRHDDAQLRLSLAELELRLGHWETGWANMDSRFGAIAQLGAQQELRERQLGVPRWHGEPLAGRTLGIWLEQGHGDAILLVRFLPRFARSVRERGGRLVFGCFGPLAELFRLLIPAEVELDIDHLRLTDYHLPLMSACAAFGISEADVSGTPYLTASAALTSEWRRQLAKDPRLQVALAWTGNPQQVRNALRSLGHSDLRSLMLLDKVLFHSVNPQVSELAQQLAAEGFPIVDHSRSLASFADTAALLASVDCVVSTCTSTAHLAGALGAPTLLLLDRVGSYLWRQDECITPWYDSVRIVRQQCLGDWAGVVAQVRRELLGRAQEKSACSE
ncbi:tetratricopeptide repeat-containing glycosyltransferase family protein [Pseudomonas sp. CAN2814]|uniref:tetratricopeptide repeat-containing glycosyltransferase family protein n=1 Tax=Pseudomonas sp. CAN1 TaxID=3046726 RepID=UPI0026477A9D|nr:tetratricopeptide repeat-containing glycosyltransferase family protein [Pseudomonas sp. CAN1]MDN6859905.1 tetratricopeptide repeat-containing glycosyltransferase family protein [Pseudomonas sp. CAN1]